MNELREKIIEVLNRRCDCNQQKLHHSIAQEIFTLFPTQPEQGKCHCGQYCINHDNRKCMSELKPSPTFAIKELKAYVEMRRRIDTDKITKIIIGNIKFTIEAVGMPNLNTNEVAHAICEYLRGI